MFEKISKEKIFAKNFKSEKHSNLLINTPSRSKQLLY